MKKTVPLEEPVGVIPPDSVITPGVLVHILVGRERLS